MAVKLTKKIDLEQENFVRQSDSDKKVREMVCQNRKEELSRLLGDLQRMHSDFSIDNTNSIDYAQQSLAKLDREKNQLHKISELLQKAAANDPINCPSDQMATIANNLESIRRSILTVNSKNTKLDTNNDNFITFFSKLDSKQIVQIGFLFLIPIILTMIICLITFSIIFVTVF